MIFSLIEKGIKGDGSYILTEPMYIIDVFDRISWSHLLPTNIIEFL